MYESNKYTAHTRSEDTDLQTLMSQVVVKMALSKMTNGDDLGSLEVDGGHENVE